MRLKKELLSEYLAYIFTDDSPHEHMARLKHWELKASENMALLENYFLSVNSSQDIDAAIHVTHFTEATYAIQLPSRVIKDETVQAQKILDLLSEVVERLKEMGAKCGEFRLTERPHLLPISTRLPKLHFSLSHVRIEFRADLVDLPNDDDSPLLWIPVSEAGHFTLNNAAKILESAGDGDPDWSSEDVNLKLLKSYLNDPEFKSTLDSIHIGVIENQPAAIVIAQVIANSGWSRLTYMGLLPKFRSKGLGQWVHRHGFEMMRAQGGKLYHGGTIRGNQPMERLFQKHGCREFRTMQDWRIQL
jgi:hypothetical protein